MIGAVYVGAAVVALGAVAAFAIPPPARSEAAVGRPEATQARTRAGARRAEVGAGPRDTSRDTRRLQSGPWRNDPAR